MTFTFGNFHWNQISWKLSSYSRISFRKSIFYYFSRISFGKFPIAVFLSRLSISSRVFQNLFWKFSGYVGLSMYFHRTLGNVLYRNHVSSSIGEQGFSKEDLDSIFLLLHTSIGPHELADPLLLRGSARGPRLKPILRNRVYITPPITRCLKLAKWNCERNA